MLFNSLEYILLFLPVIGLSYQGLIHLNLPGYAKILLIMASLFFYAWWRLDYLLLLLVSILINFSLGGAISNKNQKTKNRKLYLCMGLTFNLLLLVYFKYLYFFSTVVSQVFNTEFSIEQIILPLAISFFTFQQIAYLVDNYKDKVSEHNFSNYLLFICFFPQLISGPIVHHSDVISQFKSISKTKARVIASGITLFIIGLFKKVIIADYLSVHADTLFVNTADLFQVSSFDAWLGALAYTFEIYFDFSGYTDMAIGSALIFGIYIPINFNSPYKQINIIRFWQTWHMTLSRFLKDYLYIPLGGNRKGEAKKKYNLMITMLLGGLWHGASYQFIIWGGLHGLMLIINHSFQSAIKKGNNKNRMDHATFRVIAWFLTFMCLVITWVYFKANTLSDANTVILSMFGIYGTVNINETSIYQSPTLMASVLMVLVLVVKFSPNSNQIVGYTGKSIEQAKWRYNSFSAVLISLMLFVSLLKIMMAGYEEFIYRFF